MAQSSPEPNNKDKDEIVSLLMSKEEETSLKTKKEPLTSPEKQDLPKASYLLQGIIFIDADHWTAWIDGTAYTPTQAHLGSLTLKALSGQCIEITHDNGHRTLLFTGQSYVDKG